MGRGNFRPKWGGGFASNEEKRSGEGRIQNAWTHPIECGTMSVLWREFCDDLRSFTVQAVALLRSVVKRGRQSGAKLHDT